MMTASEVERLEQLRSAFAVTGLPLPQFTETGLMVASRAWGYNCGPVAIAGICGRTLDDLRPHLGDFERKQYMNPSLMYEVLRSLKVRFDVNPVPLKARGDRRPWPRYGLARVQWEGPWMAPEVPIGARYRKTHWVGAGVGNGGAQWIFDVNCMNVGGWVPAEEWEQYVAPWIVKMCVPRGTGGWHLTHGIEVAR